ncbi:hypothetical protein [Fictibacillus halophilus]|uniref:hypothetical protein n=1 Tax=Fictibacillus halophilus TaxID=1610490 RepID=UPI001CF96E84|nr:hypothetical protein [Fictibacillus halophilus]
MTEKKFNSLRDQIINKEKWNENQFYVFDYEAGTGKSQNTFVFLGEMTKNYSYRVIYVQRFLRDDELSNTVASINNHAGKRVADSFTGNDAKSEVRRKKAKESQVLCITHKMYQQICKGNHQGLIKNREILIIDEFPDLLEKVSLSKRDIGEAWMDLYKYNNPCLQDLIYKLKEKMIFYIRQKKKQMWFINFKDSEYEEVKIELQKVINSIGDKKESILLLKIQQIINNGCFFYENSFHTYNNQIKFKMLKNNIILDANGGFDYRYSLSNKYHVIKQPKFHDYSPSIFRHYEVKTGKKDIAKMINLPEKAFQTISPELKGKSLFICDKENKTNLEKKLKSYLFSLGYEAEKVKEILDQNIKVDYFGNLIGVNTYKDFNTVVVLKTPNYDYLTYALTYFYYCSTENIELGNIQVFNHIEIEEIRKTTVAGEIYQAIKRINRNNSKPSEIVVFTANQDAIDIVMRQLPNIKFIKEQLEVSKSSLKNESKRTSSFETKLEGIKKILLEQKSEGETSIRKQDLRKRIGETDKGNFGKLLRSMKSFLDDNKFINERQKIIL